MIRSRWIGALICLALVGAALPDQALAQTQPRPRVRGKTYKLKIDSSPQQAAVFWDAGDRPRDYGVAGYTPLTIKVPKGRVKIILELSGGWKPLEQTLDVRKNQTLTYTMERAPQPAKLDIQSATDGSAVGGEVVIDGAPRGTVPNSFDLVAGRHQIEVRKQGFKPFSDWVTLAESERRTRDISLERAEAPSGTLLVTSDAGGDVYVDGVKKDAAPAIITGVPAGEHVVEVRKEGLPPWRQTVNVPSGGQAKVAANFGAAAAPAAASLRVISSESDVTVFVDGEDKGKSPITIPNIKPGAHIIEGRKKLFKPNEQNISVAVGENALVRLKMEPAPPDRPRAGMKIQSTTPNAEVFVDGSSLGRAPVDRTDLDPGKHYVVVHKDGFTDFKREVVLLENQSITLVADLSATGALRVLSTPDGADVRIDGELIGKTPISRDAIAAGEHVVEFRMRGYFDKKENMKVEGGREKIFSVDLKQIPTGPTPEQVSKRRQAMSSFGARVNPVGAFTADFGGGYPYYFTLRLTVGAYPLKPKGLDMGVEFQTFFQIYNLAIHARLGLVEAGPLSVAVRADVGGGTGTKGRDTRFLDVMAIASLAFSDIAAVSGTLHYSAWSDKFCPSGNQRRNGVEPEDYCDATPSMFTKDPNTNRFSGSRLYLGINTTAALDRMTSLFLQIEFLPFPDEFSWEPRPAFLDSVNSSMAEKDTYVYGMGGVTLKF